MASDKDFSVCVMAEKHIREIAMLEKENFSEPWSETSIRESAENNTEFFVAADKNGSVLGYVGLNFVLDEGYITSICVKASSRNSGIATSLLKRCFDFAKEKNLSFISLEVRKSNEKAISLYKSLEFKEEGLRKNFYSYPKEDAIIFTRRF